MKDVSVSPRQFSLLFDHIILMLFFSDKRRIYLGCFDEIA
jgi:hypothetical protein